MADNTPQSGGAPSGDHDASNVRTGPIIVDDDGNPLSSADLGPPASRNDDFDKRKRMANAVNLMKALQSQAHAGPDDSDSSDENRRSKKKRKSSKSKSKAKGPQKPKKKGGSKKQHPEEHLKHLFTTNVFDHAQNGPSRPQPGFSAATTNKTDMFKQLLDFLPPEDRNRVKEDQVALDNALKMFGTDCVLEGAEQDPRYRIRGMKTGLKNYQLVGAAFVKSHELGPPPNSSFIADYPGLGKTLTCLSLIVNQLKSADNRPRATLIIVPSHLLGQWVTEIQKHVLSENVKPAQGIDQLNFCQYRAPNRVEYPEILAGFDIVLTTYHELRRSCPSKEPPNEIQDEDERRKWWEVFYEKNKGQFHRVHWNRVVVDEAANIKNHSSHLSVACRALTADNRLLLDGAPLHNDLMELYPYFDFMKIPCTGTRNIFRQNFIPSAPGSDPDKLLRVATILHRYMIRRGYHNEMFNAPIERIPSPFRATAILEFSPLELAIYQIVENRIRERFDQAMGDFEQDKRKKTFNILILLLRLREVTAHPLLIRQTYLDILEDDDVEEIDALIEKADESSTVSNHESIKSRRKLLTMTDDPENTRQVVISERDARQAGKLTDLSDPMFDSVGSFHGIKSSYKPFFEHLKAEREKIKRAENDLLDGSVRCVLCDRKAKTPYQISCGHIFCYNCLEGLATFFASRGERTKCSQCKVEYTYSGPYVSPEVVEQDLTETDQDPQAEMTSDALVLPQAKKKKKKTTEASSDWLQLQGFIPPSTKTLAIKSQIINWKSERDEEGRPKATKIIVFTLWREMITIVSRLCTAEKWGFIQYHGGMDPKAKAIALEKFKTDPEIDILVASLKAGGVGLNITESNRAILVDLWWNSPIEAQSFGRIYRIGQETECQLLRLAVQDSVDWRMYKLQERKKKECDGVMKESDYEDLTDEELRYLFNPETSEENATPFVYAEKGQFTIPNPAVEKQREETANKKMFARAKGKNWQTTGGRGGGGSFNFGGDKDF